MFTANGLLQFFIILFISGTVISNGVLMYNEKDTLDFKNLNKYQKIYTVTLVSCEVYLAIILLYVFAFYLYYYSLKCCSDTPIVHSFNIWYFLFFILGLVAHGYVLYHVLFHKDYIDENVENIAIIFCANVGAILLSMIVINIYKKCFSKKKDYVDLTQ